MKISKSRIQEIIQEEIVKEIEFRTGVPEEDILTHGSDLEKYPTTKEEEMSEAISVALEDLLADAVESRGGPPREKWMADYDEELNDEAMRMRDRILAAADEIIEQEEEERNRTSKGGAYAGEGNVQLRKMADPGTWK